MIFKNDIIFKCKGNITHFNKYNGLLICDINILVAFLSTFVIGLNCHIHFILKKKIKIYRKVPETVQFSYTLYSESPNVTYFFSDLLENHRHNASFLFRNY
jgi:hypothetical protein